MTSIPFGCPDIGSCSCDTASPDDPERNLRSYFAATSMQGFDGGGTEPVLGPADIHLKISSGPQAFDLSSFPGIRQGRQKIYLS